MVSLYFIAGGWLLHYMVHNKTWIHGTFPTFQEMHTRSLWMTWSRLDPTVGCPLTCCESHRAVRQVCTLTLNPVTVKALGYLLVLYRDEE